MNVPMNTGRGVHFTRETQFIPPSSSSSSSEEEEELVSGSCSCCAAAAAVEREKEPIDCGISEIIFFITILNSILYAHFSNGFLPLSLDRSVKLIQMIPMNKDMSSGGP